MTIDLGHWHTSRPPNNDKWFGFVYLINNKTKDKSYIGMKQRKVKRKKKYVESSWKTYTGSNKELNEHIAQGDDCQFLILEWAYSKADLKYLEIKHQVNHNALKKSSYYNQCLGAMRWTRCLADKV